MFIDCAVTSKDYAALAALWERSVRATHHFLPEERIFFYREQIPAVYFPQVDLCVARNAEGKILGFMGLELGGSLPEEEEAAWPKVAMLFVDPVFFGQKVGSTLLRYAMELYGPLEVDVNEQNGGACAFYEKMGFVPFARSETDDAGDPFPLVHLRQEQA